MLSLVGAHGQDKWFLTVFRPALTNLAWQLSDRPELLS